MKLCPYVPVDQEVVTLQSTGVAGSTTGRMTLTGGVATQLEHQAQDQLEITPLDQATSCPLIHLAPGSSLTEHDWRTLTCFLLAEVYARYGSTTTRMAQRTWVI